MKTKIELVEAALSHCPVISILRGISDLDDFERAAEALVRGGISMIEVALDQTSLKSIQNSLNGIKRVNEVFGDSMLVGAGTVLTAKQVAEAKDAGAQYIISPSSSQEVIEATKEFDLVSIPGTFTATEAVNAHTWGADYIKLFPAGDMGPGYLKSLKAPLPHLRFIAVGNINAGNAKAFLEAGACGLGVGGNLVSTRRIRERAFGEITDTAKELLSSLV